MQEHIEVEKIGFFTRVFSSKLRMYLRELVHVHNLKIDEINAKFEREHKYWEEDKKRALSTMTQEHELKLKEAITLANLSSQQQAKQAELDFQRKLNQETEKLNKNYYDKLTEAMTKLHEDGNITTKFTQELALKMMESIPSHKSETKVLTGKVEIEKP